MADCSQIKSYFSDTIISDNKKKLPNIFIGPLVANLITALQ